MSKFGWDYPPGVSGNEPEITGEWPEEECSECDGTGEREIQIGGDDSEYGPAAALADVPVVCGHCEGSGKEPS